MMINYDTINSSNYTIQNDGKMRAVYLICSSIMKTTLKEIVTDGKRS